MKADTVDVIVIGGGIGGLSAAYYLVRGGKRCLVLEGRDRLGGKAATDPERPWVEGGAQYVGPFQQYTMGLCDELGVDRVPHPLSKDHDHVLRYKDRSKKFRHVGFPTQEPKDYTNQALSPWDTSLVCEAILDLACEPQDGDAGDPQNDVLRGIVLIEDLVRQARVHLHEPWEIPRARALDRVSVEEWSQEHLESEYARSLLTIGVRAAMSAEPKEVSMLYFLFYAASTGSAMNFLTIGGDADSHMIRGGVQQLAVRLAKELEQSTRCEIRTGTRVTAIQQDGDGVEVITATGARLRASRCVVAMSQPVAARLAYEPSLPPEKRKLADMRPGRTIKAFVDYRYEWWRDDHVCSGYSLSVGQDDRFITWTMHNTWKDQLGEGDPRDARPTAFSLMAFITAERADRLAKLSKEDRKEKVLDNLEWIFGATPGSTREHVIRYHEGVWGEREPDWAGGGPGAFFGPRREEGDLSFFEHGRWLRKPHQRVHWAGAETAMDWAGGYMNGAIQAGMRVAHEILALP